MVFWVTAFLDFTADEFDAEVGFWSDVTGYAVSPTRGIHGEFATLVPQDGDAFLRVQRLADGPSRIHLDLHVDDPSTAAQRAVELGAEVVGHPDPGRRRAHLAGGFHVLLRARARGGPPPACGLGGGQLEHLRPGVPRHPSGSLRNRVHLLVRPHGLGAASVSGGGGVRLPGPAARDTDPDPACRDSAIATPESGRIPTWPAQTVPPRLIGTSSSVRSWSACTNGGPCCAAPQDRRTASPTETRRPGCSTESRWLGLSKPTSVGVVTTQRTDPPLAADEATTLLAFLDFHRDTLRMKTDGLDQAGLGAALAPSTMTLGGMLKHLSLVESSWFSEDLLGEPMMPPFDAVDWDADRDWEWHSAAEDTPEELRALFDEALCAFRRDHRRRAGRRWPGDVVGCAEQTAPRGAVQSALDHPAHDRGVRAPQRPRRPDPGVDRRRDRRMTSSDDLAPGTSAMSIRPATDADWPRIWPIFSATVLAGETYAFPMDLTVETGRGWWMESAARRDRRTRGGPPRT